jgi:hypothetical protein
LTKLSTIEHRYVEAIPKVLDPGMLYISERYRTASHLCACGCGTRVATPLNPAKWRLVDHGVTVSLSPSIGLGTLPCKSHYWIRRSRVDWYPPMTEWQTDRAQRADRYASQVYTGERLPPPPFQAPPPAGPGFWAQLLAWFSSLWR